MENAVDALKMAFAVIVFVLALTIGIAVFTQARTASDVILHGQDSTEYYNYIHAGIYDDETGEWISTGETRIVGIETVIPTLYRYYKENYTVIFLEADGTPLELYETMTEPTLWSGSDPARNYIAPIVSKYYDGSLETHLGVKSNDLKICAFDLDEETNRHEPWTGNANKDAKKNLDAFLNGGEFAFPSNDGRIYKYKGFINKYGDKKFRELMGEYNYDLNANSDEPETNTHGAYDDTIKNKKKRVIVYQIVNQKEDKE